MNDGKKLQLIGRFMSDVREDPRISAVHISLYVALVCLCENKDTLTLHVFSHEVMPVCKISGSSTYHRSIRELSQYGYVNYVPSFNHNEGSRVEFVLKV